MTGRTKTERVLWDYNRNLQRVYELRLALLDLSSAHSQSYGPHVVNGVSDAVADVVHKVIALERKIAGAEREIQAVQQLKDSLDITDFDMYLLHIILTQRYIAHSKTEKIIRENGLSKATYYRKKNQLLNMAEKYV